MIDETDLAFTTPTARRTTFDKSVVGVGGTGIPTPSGIPRRRSGIAGSRRSSTGLSYGVGEGEMAPPPSSARARRLSGVGEGGVGETY